MMDTVSLEDMMKKTIVLAVLVALSISAASADILGKVKGAAGAAKNSATSAGSKAKGLVDRNPKNDASLFPLASAATCTSKSPAVMSVKVDWLQGSSSKRYAAAVEIRDGQRTEASRDPYVFPLAVGEKVCPVEIKVRKNFVDITVVTAVAHTLTGKEGQSISGPLWAEMVFKTPNAERMEQSQLRELIGQVITPFAAVPVEPASAVNAPAPAPKAPSANEAGMVSIDVGDPVAKVEKAAGAPIGHIGAQTVYSYMGVKVFVQDGKVVRVQ